VDEGPYPFGFGELVVERYRFPGRKSVDLYPFFIQQQQGVGVDPQAPVVPRREDHDFSTVLEEFQYIGRLDAGLMMCAFLTPIPLPRTSREEFGILEPADTIFDLN